MKHQWWAYSIVAFLSVGAGVAIAGLPGSEAVDPTIVPPPSTEVVAPETVATTLPPVVETDPPETTTTEATTTSVPPETTITTTTTEPEPVLPSRSELAVVVANGANIGGIASATARDLEELGYADVRPTDGTAIVVFSIVYYVEGFERSAARLAVDLGLEPTAVAPITEAPDIIGDLGGESLLAYLGSDRA